MSPGHTLTEIRHCAVSKRVQFRMDEILSLKFSYLRALGHMILSTQVWTIDTSKEKTRSFDNTPHNLDELSFIVLIY